MDDTLARFLAQQARALDPGPLTLETSDPEILRAFLGTVLEELHARGLLAGDETVGCWSAPRVTGH